MKLLVTGASGQVGYELSSLLRPLGEVLPLDRGSLDLTDVDAIRACIAAYRPDVLLNAAAYTAVDQAESEPELAHAINAIAPGVMAQEMRRLGGLLVHYSTDYVYDGRKVGPYLETDSRAPLSVYGVSKLAGEAAIAETGVDHLILRTEWVYGLRGRNFLNTVRRLAAQKPELRMVADQVGAPTWSRWIARETAGIVRACFETPAARQRLRAEWTGVYHLTAAGQTSWHGFASRIVMILAQGGLVPPVPVLPIATSDYPLPARRPANSVLDNSKVRHTFQVEQTDWQDQLDECLHELA